MVKKILIIGGTNEGNKLASFFENHNFEYIISYAGIVEEVYKKKFRKRVGGFGGRIGILNFIKKNKITHVIDASHPFSSNISINTFNVCESCNIPIVNFTRKPWFKMKGDNWIKVKNFDESIKYLKGKPKNVFLAIGKKNLHIYKKCPQNFYLLRVINKQNIDNFFPNQEYITYDALYNVEEEIKILKNYKIEIIVSKNSGGELAYSKIVAARELKIPVIIIARPKSLTLKKVYDLESVLKWLDSNE
tara:strand:+ start:787 stop:1527 length:741 start_codon:yes stop_codon:yes gene_type:complete